MALPELLMPPSLPPFMASAHARTPEGLYAPVDRMSGSSRKRRLYISAPSILEASIEVTQLQLEDFYAWHEGPLKAGEVPFTAAIAKVGAGIEYVSAICLSFKPEHQEGSHHKLQLQLRLRGEPQDSPPVLTGMSAEVVVALNLLNSATALSGLGAEVSAGLQLLLDTVDLSAEVVVALFSQFAGPSLTNTPLDAEVFVALKITGQIDPPADLTAEVSTALQVSALESISLSAEISQALLLTVSAGAGPVASPADIVESWTLAPIVAVEPPPLAFIALQVRTDGRVFVRKQLAAPIYENNWWSPTQVNIGLTHWVKIASTVGARSGGGVENAGGWRAITSDVAWTISTSGTVFFVSESLVPVSIASDPDGLNVVSNFLVSLSATFTPPP